MRNRNDKRCGHFANPKSIQHQVIAHRSKKRVARIYSVAKIGTFWVPVGFFGWQRNGRPPAGLEEMLHVYWNYHPDHSRYRVARGLQRHRRRTVLRHRLLRRRRTWPHRRHPADSATARKNLSSRSQNGAEFGDAESRSFFVARRNDSFARTELLDRSLYR